MEIWDLYDSKGNKTGKTHLRSKPLKPGDFHMVVENWVINSRGEYLIQKRNKPLRDYIDPWSTTAGSATKGEKSIEAVRRETAEEIGISFKESDFIFIQRHLFEDFFMDVYETRWNGNTDDLNFDPVEVTALKWVTKAELIAMHQAGDFFSHRTAYLNDILEDKSAK